LASQELGAGAAQRRLFGATPVTAALKLAETAASPAAARDANILAMAQAARSAWGSANAQPVAPAEARQALTKAQASRAAAQAALEAAQLATGKARAYLVQARAEVAHYTEVERGAATERAAELKAAMKGGRTARDVAHLPAKHAQERLEAETKLKASEQAFGELAAEQAEADRVLNEAKAKLAEAVKAVVVAEADALACEVDRLEGAVAVLREKLGPLARWPYGRTATLSRVMAASDWFTNGPEDRRSQAYGFRWSAFSTALESKAGAALDFANLVV
jgi:hypothetical protein